jgi:hypothetical protein
VTMIRSGRPIYVPSRFNNFLFTTASVEAATVQLVPVNMTSHLHVEYMELNLHPPYAFTARCSVQHFLLHIVLKQSTTNVSPGLDRKFVF